jgi:RNA polymerase sigma factor (sigma-70 family)
MRDDDGIEKLVPALRRFALGLCRNPTEADDLVQDCVERALGRWHLKRPDGNLKAWLFTILYNEFINGRRRFARRGPAQSIDELPIEPGIAEDQEQNLYVRDVMDGIERLPPDHRAVILLVGVEDMSYDDAARTLGVPIGTVMSRLSRARERLRVLLDVEPQPPARLRSVK